MASTYYKITEKELLALVATAETCRSIGEELAGEANESQKAIRAIEKRNKIKVDCDYSEQINKIKI